MLKEFSEVEKNKYIITHHSAMTTKAMAEALGKKPSWVEARIAFLIREGFIKTRKRVPYKNLKEELKKALSQERPGTQKSQSNTTAALLLTQETNKKKEKDPARDRVPPGWRRASVVIKEERIRDMEDLRWYTRRLLREIQDEAFGLFIAKNKADLTAAREARAKAEADSKKQ